ncbi:hypothetical protein KLVA5327_22310 [Klebsiella variicola subsp. variicola]|uniref:Uncharacterized protein n=1 Tax=Klebsiella variicola TaxID=244366 RepID=A0A9P0Y679_KLEVA|nr:hypothetical protein AE06_04361 [Klebsiella variicola]MBB3336638.1 hypothetical protein [Klebsiella sp. RC2]MDR6262216.1 hypothetical protein [Klebsiella sp. SORGH_AS_0826]MDR6344542.1 hypothetical protein [Klebsiella sp. SORGH_AS_1025]MDR6361635.1 hypothetical protein [Klebsiella sp. SORGH_AS_1173]SWI96579.1 Uncharacterised protein [Klebsiella pneumoniae]
MEKTFNSLYIFTLILVQYINEFRAALTSHLSS